MGTKATDKAVKAPRYLVLGALVLVVVVVVAVVSRDGTPETEFAVEPSPTTARPPTTGAEVPVTTTVPETTTTTGAPAIVPPTTGASRAAVAAAPKPVVTSPPVTTVAPVQRRTPTTATTARTVTVSPTSSPRSFSVRGTGCFGSNAAGFVFVDAGPEHGFLGGPGVVARADGVWSTPVTVPPEVPAGTKVMLQPVCRNLASMTNFFEYPPQPVTVA